jgi:predicted nucleotidyltransferase
MNKTNQKNPILVSKLKSFFLRVARNYQLELVFLYGSQALGFGREDSDIDVAILFSSGLSEAEIFSSINNLSLKLSELMGTEVNILPLYEDFRNPMVYFNAIVLGVPIYIRDFNKYIDIKIMAIHQMEDFSIFGIKWQLDLARKNLEALKNG